MITSAIREIRYEAEVAILDRLAGDADPPAKPAVSHYLVAIAKPGGYLADEGPAAGEHGGLAG